MKNILIAILILFIAIYAGINRGPILSARNPSVNMFVNLRTDNSCLAEVHYRQLPAGSWDVVCDSVPASLHYLEMTVSSYAQYEYYVYADGDSVGPYEFWTAPMPNQEYDFDFCVYGDTRTSIVAHWVVIDHVMTCNPMFMLHSGDMIEDGEDTDDWDDYFSELCDWHDIAQSVPYFYAMGNHDDEAPYFYDAVTLPCNNPAGTEAYSSFDWGKIHFTIINSEIDYTATSEQYAFLSADLAAASANPMYDFIIAFVHRPFYSSGYHGREEEMAAVLEPLLVANGVDLVLQGHDHMYERVFPQDGVHYIVTGGGGAPPSPVVLWRDWTAFGYNLYHHLDCHYKFAEHKLSIYMHNYANEIVDSLILVAIPVGTGEVASKKRFPKLTAYPNPFNTSCRIAILGFNSDNISNAEMKIFDLKGKCISRINRIPGRNDEFIWQPDSKLESGIYIVRISTDRWSAMKEVVFVR
ncbi:hypothetical protein DRQ33_08020 [bacterium]|nr:MAG: hypothetical protein DRQ33_08020 [bacterium]